MSKLLIRRSKDSESSAERWKPHKYQTKAIRHLLERPAAALFLDPGLGKTSITLGAFKVLLKQGIAKKVLVIAPLRVAYAVWPYEVKKWADFEHLKVTVLHGLDKEDKLKEQADIYVINPEGLQWLFKGNRFKNLGIDTLVVDESSKFKHPSTARFKALKPWLPKFRRRWILTGTPAPNGLMDLFGQCYIMDLGHALGPYITHFRAHYFVPLDRLGYTWAPAEGAEEAIYEKLRPYALRLSAADYLDLPPLLENIVKVDLPPKARKVYDDLESELLAEIEGGSIAVALSRGAAAIKCRQVANGGLYLQFDADDRPLLKSNEWTHLHDAKTEAVVDLVEELQGAPVLIAYHFAHDRARLLKAFGKDTPYIGGGISPKATEKIVQDWNAGKIPVLLIHPAAASHGLNMQAAGCAHVIWYSLTYDLEHDEQLIKRVWRQGTKAKSVTVHRIVARDTYDEVIIRALRRKGKTQGSLLNALTEAFVAYSKGQAL